VSLSEYTRAIPTGRGDAQGARRAATNRAATLREDEEKDCMVVPEGGGLRSMKAQPRSKYGRKVSQGAPFGSAWSLFFPAGGR
jgi:hypothetical protein